MIIALTLYLRLPMCLETDFIFCIFSRFLCVSFLFSRRSCGLYSSIRTKGTSFTSLHRPWGGHPALCCVLWICSSVWCGECSLRSDSVLQQKRGTPRALKVGEWQREEWTERVWGGGKERRTTHTFRPPIHAYSSLVKFLLILTPMVEKSSFDSFHLKVPHHTR